MASPSCDQAAGTRNTSAVTIRKTDLTALMWTSVWFSHFSCRPRRQGCSALLLFFRLLAACLLSLGNDLLLQLLGYDVVMMHFHVEAAAALCHRRKIDAICQHF